MQPGKLVAPSQERLAATPSRQAMVIRNFARFQIHLRVFGIGDRPWLGQSQPFIVSRNFTDDLPVVTKIIRMQWVMLSGANICAGRAIMAMRSPAASASIKS
jgi:hypothetical protein